MRALLKGQFGRQFDKSVKYSKLVTDPFATDYALLAAASAMTGDMTGAKSAAAEVVRLDPNWTVEKYLSDGGGFPDEVAMLFVDGARKAGVSACVPADRLPSMPNLIRIKTLRRREGAASNRLAWPNYFRLGKLNSEPPLMPDGQRAVTVLSRV